MGITKHSITLEHIDPISSQHVCGLRNEFNEIMAVCSYNARKCNRFVPYRVHSHPAPVTFGDTGEFLIEGEWVICEFGGEAWWAESARIGCANAPSPTFEDCQKGGRIGGKRGAAALVRTGQFEKFRMSGTLSRRKAVVVVHPASCGIWEFDSTQDAANSRPISRAGLRQTAAGHKESVKGFICTYV